MQRFTRGSEYDWLMAGCDSLERRSAAAGGGAYETCAFARARCFREKPSPSSPACKQGHESLWTMCAAPDSCVHFATVGLLEIFLHSNPSRQETSWYAIRGLNLDMQN